MSRENEFNEDPPTVVVRPTNAHKPDPPPIELVVDPYDSFRFAVTAWAARNFHWFDEYGMTVGVAIVSGVTWFLFKVMGAL